jgi:hypothetical protein
MDRGTVTPRNNGSAGCTTPAGCQEIVLTGSQSAATTTTGTWASGSNLVSVSSTNLNFAAVGQKVTSSTGCIPANTYAGDALKEVGQVYLVHSDMVAPQLTTCPETTPQNIVFTDSPATFVSSSNTTVTISAIYRHGDGIHLENDGGVTINRCQSLNHDNAIHLYGTSAGPVQNTVLEGCDVELGTGDNPLTNDEFCGLLADGDHTAGNDAGDYTIVGGNWGQGYPTPICVNSNSVDAGKLVGPTVGPSAGKRYGAMIKLLQGSLAVSSAQAHLRGNIVVAAGATLNLSSSYMPQAQLYGQDSTVILNGCGNTIQSEEVGGSFYPAAECIGIRNPGFVPVYNSTGVVAGGQKMVTGNVTLALGARTVNLSGSAAFTSSSMYSCSLVDLTGANPLKLTKTSGTAFTIAGTGSDQVDYRCLGN